jgi:uncharacterized protein involved in outer membrane biogenesis
MFIYTIVIFIILFITIATNIIIRKISQKYNDIPTIPIEKFESETSYSMAIDKDGKLHIWGEGIDNDKLNKKEEIKECTDSN